MYITGSRIIKLGSNALSIPMNKEIKGSREGNYYFLEKPVAERCMHNFFGQMHMSDAISKNIEPGFSLTKSFQNLGKNK